MTTPIKTYQSVGDSSPSSSSTSTTIDDEKYPLLVPHNILHDIISPISPKDNTDPNTYFNPPLIIKSPKPERRFSKSSFKSSPEEALHSYELVNSFYDLEDVREPPEDLISLKIFYIFFLSLGVCVKGFNIRAELLANNTSNSIHHTKLNNGENLMCILLGTVPHSSRLWKLIIRLQYVYAIISFFCIFYYTLVNIITGLESTSFRYIKVFEAIFLGLAVISSQLLGHDILAKKLIGTRIYYAAKNTTKRPVIIESINKTLYTQIFTCIFLGLMGFYADCRTSSQRFDLITDFTHETYYSYFASILWVFCSFLVNIHLVAGISIFASLAGINVVRIQSCIRSLKRPGTTIKAALAQMFDIDVTVAELSIKIGFRLTLLLVCTFLSFFFEAVYLTNTHAAAAKAAAAASITTSASSSHINSSNVTDLGKKHMDLLTLAHAGLLCGYILLTCGFINSAAQELKLVAFRFAVFQQKTDLEVRQKQYAKKLAVENAALTSPNAKLIKTNNDTTAIINNKDKDYDPKKDNKNPFFKEELDFFNSYCNKSDISMRLANIQLSSSVAWAFS